MRLLLRRGDRHPSVRHSSMPLNSKGGGERSERRVLCSGARVRVLRRPWTEGRLRMGERAAAVGSALAVSFLRRSSSGSFQMLCRDSVSLRFVRLRRTPHAALACRNAGRGRSVSGMTYGRPMAVAGVKMRSRTW